MNAHQLKQQAAQYTVDHYITSGMVVGLGEGSTSKQAVHYLAKKIKDGDLTNILAIAASEKMTTLAQELGIPLTTFEENPLIDLTFDGADEVDDKLNLIKGGGGALLREKILAQESRQEIIMVDDSKLSTYLGEKWAVPVEVLPFGFGTHKRHLESLGGQPQLRLRDDGSPYQTDQGNYILDTNFGEIVDPFALSEKISAKAGIIEHGLFVELTSVLVVAGQDGVFVKQSTNK